MRRTKREPLDYATAGPVIAAFARNAGRDLPLLDSFSSVGDTLHCIKPLSGERVLHLVVEQRSFNVAVIRRAVESVVARPV